MASPVRAAVKVDIERTEIREFERPIIGQDGGLLRVEDTDPGGQPPGTSIYVLLPGRPMPTATYPTRTRDGLTDKNTRPEAETDAATDVAGNTANSRDSANVISVDSQSARAR